MPAAPRVTVAICTRDRRDDLVETLESLASQEAAVPWEVLVVDNASTDGTSEAARGRAAAFAVPVRVEVEPVAGLSHARNRALAAARGDIVLFLDDDVTCDPGWLAAMARAHRDAAVVATAGRIVPRLPPGVPAWIVRAAASGQGGPFSRYDYGTTPCDIGAVRGMLLPIGANFGVRVEAARAAGGFRTDLGWGPNPVPGEETALLRALRATGARMRYVPDGRVEHRIAAARTEIAAILRWHRAYGRGTVRIAGATPEERRIALARERRKATLYRGLAAITPGRVARLRRRIRLARSLGRIDALSEA